MLEKKGRKKKYIIHTNTSMTTLTNAQVAPMLPVVDLERAKKFYQEKLGLTPMAMSMPGMAFYTAGKGTMLGLYQRDATKADHTVACFEVPNIAATVAELKANGVVFEEYDMEGFKTVDSVVTEGSHKAAWFKDTEGNILGLDQMS